MDRIMMGAIALGSLLVALFFLRFWQRSRDRFFLYFAASFALEALNRLALAILVRAREDEPAFYLVRVVAYGLILAAVWQKNRADD